MKRKPLSRNALIIGGLLAVIVVILLITNPLAQISAVVSACLIAIGLISSGKKVIGGSIIVALLAIGYFSIIKQAPTIVEAADVSPTSVATAAPTEVPAPEAQESGGNCDLSPGWNAEPTIVQWEGLIEKACNDTGVEANLIAAVIRQESVGDPKAYSTSGAVGLMQVMPNDGLSRTLFGSMFADRPSTQELWDPAANIKEGSEILAGKLSDWGDIMVGLYYYNGGGDPDFNTKVIGYYNDYSNH